MIHHSGIGTYLLGLLGKFENHPFFRERSLRLAVGNSFSNEFGGADGRIRFRSPIYSLWEQLEYPFHLNRCRLWHAPHYNVPVVKGRSRLVVTVHDLIHWIFRKEFFSLPQAVYTRFLFQRVVRLADRIITVSEQTKDDLVLHFKARPDGIRVIHEGVSEEFFSPPEAIEREKCLQKYGLPGRFFLYVGLIKPHKNVDRLVEVFRKLRGERKLSSSLVVIGPKSRRYPRAYHSLQRLRSENGVHYLPRVESRRDLISLYASALALIHPSYYEGFGLTSLEAMAAGTPVIVSRAASLPEVVGDAGRYVDPYSNASLAESMVEVEGNERLRKELAEKGRTQARKFSWAEAAEKTIEVYRNLLDNP